MSLAGVGIEYIVGRAPQVIRAWAGGVLHFERHCATGGETAGRDDGRAAGGVVCLIGCDGRRLLGRWIAYDGSVFVFARNGILADGEQIGTAVTGQVARGCCYFFAGSHDILQSNSRRRGRTVDLLSIHAATMDKRRNLCIGRYSQARWEFRTTWEGKRDDVALRSMSCATCNGVMSHFQHAGQES
ncbi:hypothetical protein D3C79_621790 [compost metagenome]